MRLRVGGEIGQANTLLIAPHIEAGALELVVIGDLGGSNELAQPGLLVLVLRELVAETEPLSQVAEDVIVVTHRIRGASPRGW